MRAFWNGRISRPGVPDASAILVRGGRIAAIGTDREILALAAGARPPIDLRGGLVLPGFQDAHIHLCQEGRRLSRPDLGGARSLVEALALADRHRRTKKEGVLFLERFDESAWPERRSPLREELDAIESRRPMIFRRVCGHVAVGNGAALARIPEGTPRVDRTSGRLEEEVVSRLETDLFPPGEEENRRAIVRAEEKAFSLGVTTVHEIDGPAVADVYRTLDRERRLRLRVFFFAVAPVAEAARLRREEGRNFHVAGAKVFLDGSIGGRTAALAEPYAGGGRGVLLTGAEEIARIVAGAERLGVPLLFHAIGDRAIDEALCGFARAAPRPRLPHRIEHAEMLGDEGAERVAALGLRLSMQPNFAARWGGGGGMYEERLGRERAAGLNRIGSWVRRGLPVAFGSDAMPFNPFYGLAGAIEHPVRGERLTPAEALRCYTASAERFLLGGGRAGVLAEGKRADFLEFDSPAGTGGVLRREDLRRTVAAGEIVHER